MSPPKLSLYLHVPFCRALCHYCDFAKTANFDTAITDRYFHALPDHLDLWFAMVPFESFSSVFLGGGTPSLFTREWEDVFARIKPRLQETTEVTLEANPDDITAENLAVWRELGINRLSIGVQTWQADGLATMKRLHRAKEASEAIRLAKDGMPQIGVDLIYGWPGQTARAWEEDLMQALAHAPDHISAYVLTFEPRTPLGRAYLRGKLDAEGDDALWQRYRTARDVLLPAGYEHGEVSNFAKPGKLSVHNRHYWEHGYYIGVGTGAHGYIPGEKYGVRFAYDRNERHLGREAPPESADDLDRFGSWERGRTAEQWLQELVLTGLRTAAGVDLSRARSVAGFDFLPSSAVEDALNCGALELHGDRLCLAPTEWFREGAWALKVTESFRPV